MPAIKGLARTEFGLKQQRKFSLSDGCIDGIDRVCHDWGAESRSDLLERVFSDEGDLAVIDAEQLRALLLHAQETLDTADDAVITALKKYGLASKDDRSAF